MTPARAMRLREAAALLGARVVPAGTPDQELGRLSCHPEHLEPGDCFGLFGEYFTYNRWFDEAAGVAAVRRVQPAVVLAAGPIEGYGGAVLAVAQPRVAFARLARSVCGAPDARLPVIGVTGTNGKTTTTHLIAHLLQRLAGSGACLGTLGTYRNGELWEEGEFTTDLALPTLRTLARLAEAETGGVAMEVSSHGLALDRVAGLRFRAGVVTNIARDHLDFHGSQEAYEQAKERLFTELEASACAVLNADDRSAARLMAATKAEVVTYGWGATADWRVAQAELRRDGARGTVEVGGQRLPFSTRLVGRFQIANVLAAAVAVASLGHEPAAVLAAAADFAPVSGRMEALGLRQGATAIIDYAHNPDGLENLLVNCRAMRPRRLLLVFGCGGDRDRGKRPLMGAIAVARADRVWVTSDNPRTEDPARIVEDILRGMPERSGVMVETDRRRAIEEAWADAREGDLLVIAGKGHEDYQILGTTKHPFSDRGELLRLERAAG